MNGFPPARARPGAIGKIGFTAYFLTFALCPGYEVGFEGVPRDVRRDLDQLSLAGQLRSAGPTTAHVLSERARKDEAIFRRYFQARGQFAAEIESEVTPGDAPDSLQVNYRIHPGPVYEIRSFEAISESTRRSLEHRVGRAAVDSEIQSGVDDAIEAWKRTGHPWAQATDVLVRVDRTATAVAVRVTIEPGPRVRIGAVEWAGLTRVDPDYAAGKSTLKEGAWFDQQDLAETRRRLLDTGLFNEVRVSPVRTLDQPDRVPIRIKVRERKFRTISLSLGYETDQGPGVALAFEHDNFRGAAEQLSTRWEGDLLGFDWETQWRKPDFRRLDQTLNLRTDLKREDTEAYEADSGSLGISLSRSFGSRLQGLIGLEGSFSRVVQDKTDDHFQLLSLPLGLEYDTRDDVLDARRGHLVLGNVTPTAHLTQADESWVKSVLAVRQYVPLWPPARVVLAGRIRVGTIVGASRGTIPAHQRFYAGGGGSIRGYEYQSAGPLDEERNPVGGRSLLETSAELRIAVTDRFGFVVFADGGVASESRRPAKGQPFLVGAGGGLRIQTPVAPLRADIAFPLDRRRGVDDAMQIYVSLGQAF